MQSLGNHFITWWEKYSRYVKLLFITSVLIFVIHALGSFFKTVEWHQVGVGLASLSWASIIFLLITGCIAVAPMLGYDFAIVHFLPGKFSRSYIIRCGWITNTLTNIAGFGGILGATLRAYFYRKSATKKDILLATSKIAVFLLSGLSILCWIALIVMFGFHDGGHFNQYAIWLVGGGLYFPVVLYFTLVNNNRLFKEVTPKLEVFIVGSSTLEWLFVALFFLFVGWCLGIRNNLINVLPLYAVAQVIGVLSMIPGALGSFDVMMVFELSLLGVPKTTIVIWILLFRIFYYVVPLILAGLLFIHNLAHQVNEFFDGLPLMLLRKTAYYLITAFMYISGVLMLLTASIPDLTAENKIIQHLYPYTFFFIHQMSTILFAIAMLACARGLQAKVKRAYWPTLALLLIGIANTIWNLGTISLTIYLVIVLLLVLMSKHVLYREKLQYSLGKFATDSLIFAGSCILYVIVGVINAPQYASKHRVPAFLFFPGERVWLSGLVGLGLGLVLMLLVIWYFTAKRDPFSAVQSFNADRARQVINTFGGNETSHLAFLRDKNLYYYQKNGQDQLFFMYRRKYDRLVVMGDPVGNQAVLREAIRQFVREADRYDYEIVFYEVSSKLTMLLHEFGFDFIKTGESGLVTLADFTLAGKKQRSQRALMHKFDREGYQFSVITPPFSDDQLKELKAVSDSWLGEQVEKGFSLGFFDPYYINQAPVGTVRDKDGKLVAFATFMPTGGKEILTIDLMRHSKDAPSGIMDKIFISMYQYGQENGYTYFDLGMAPLSNVGEYQFSFLEEKIAHFIYEYGYHLYGFQGLRRYKDKYASHWSSRYIAYRKKNSLVANMLILVSVVNQRVDQQRRHLFMWWANN
ncbi:bifunctional lysylphosphatidylglycerol flippase/synthetase MprF [Limosilactobacillus panis]|uniref:bifunctional lysylphosphatidylglycerol flippase/synthetase MprF n=1 Tax=Limosilactobacillus panis TaxID=47493 RepID=UPI001C9413C4|nr:bifunctional lysylphosphatidylglycerol flippase/synthetase MprF [Limosilactobacillus panis]QZN92711.1 bifunctional lysylphosphatidylglycerol flippase/synthetase MprF [Limosilactobacillus panis]